MSLTGMGFDSQFDFALPTILLGLLLFPWMWGFPFLGGIHHSPVVQQRAVILKVLQEKMRAHPSTPPSSVSGYHTYHNWTH